MAYQDVGGTPRFYIDIPSYLNSLGIDYDFYYSIQGVFTDLDKSLLGLNPSNMKIIREDNIEQLYLWCNFKQPWNTLGNSQQSYMGFINHNLSDSTYSIQDAENNEGIINTEMVSNDATIWNSGFNLSIFSTELEQNYQGVSKLNPLDSDGNFKNAYAGCFTLGFYYDMPVSPDLDLSMEIEYGGINNIKTLNGSTITQSNYQGSPWWYDVDGNKVEPWAVGESTGISKRNGRRVWNLKFSYMSDKDLFASNYGSSNYSETNTGYSGEDLHLSNWGENLITNGTMEVNDNWDGGGLATSEQSDEYAKNGTYSWKFIPTLQQHGIKPDSDSYYTTEINRIYKISGYVRISGSNAAQNFRLNAYNGNGSLNNRLSKTLGGSEGFYQAYNMSVLSWKYFEAYYTEQVGGDGGYIKITSSASSSGNYYVDNVEVIGTQSTDRFFWNIDNDDSFSSQVLNKISHGEKFIFQPNNNDSNPSDFAICVLDEDSFSMKRTAFNVYDIEMSIKEAW